MTKSDQDLDPRKEANVVHNTGIKQKERFDNKKRIRNNGLLKAQGKEIKTNVYTEFPS
jgi:hypothetical protein